MKLVIIFFLRRGPYPLLVAFCAAHGLKGLSRLPPFDALGIYGTLGSAFPQLADPHRIRSSKLTNTLKKTIVFLVAFPKGGNHDVHIFDAIPDGAFVDETAPLPLMYGFPNARSHFLGTKALQV